VQAAHDAGLDVDDFAGRLSFFFNAHNDLLEEVAKFRAARRLWGTVMRQRFGATKPASQQLRFHAQTSGVSLTAQQPHNNVVRVTVQALAAVLGGAQSLHTNALDEALALPTEDSVQIALRTQQILAHESGVASSIDPFAGSYAIESLTNHLESQAQALIQRIDDQGGMVRAVETGFVQREIQESAFRLQRAIETGEQVVVGVNEYRQEEGTRVPIHRVDPQLERDQVQRLQKFRAQRNADAVRRCVGSLRAAATSSDNLMPHIIDAVDNGVTLGEISDTLREVFGEHRENLTL
jgi:methylmalonyl-CoA mutase N-terminal domain/subunit